MIPHPDSVPDDSPQTTPIPEESMGLLLQRGGEELGLLKVRDRFTMRSPEIPVEQLEQTLRVQHQRQIARTQLVEFTVDAEQRDEVMQAARDREEVVFASHVYQLKDNPATLIYLGDQLTIQFHPDTDDATISAIETEFGLKSVRSLIGIPNTFIFQLTPNSPENPLKIANRLITRPQVLTAEPQIIVPKQPSYHPQDPLYPQQWYLNHNGGSNLAPSSHIDVEKAWDITRGNRSIVVAIADDAIDVNHPDFQGTGKIVAPKDLKDKDFIPLPSGSGESHGTACAGIAVAEENGQGIVGVAPRCALMPIRTSGFLDDTSIEELFDWVIENDASVVSCSWGAATVYFPLSLRQRAALTRAATEGRGGKGCVIVFAAGNANRPIHGTIFERGWTNELLHGPTNWLSGFAVHPDLIAVSACTSLRKKAAYSNWGTNVAVCAPSNNAPPGIWFEKTGFIGTAPQLNAPTPGHGIFTTDLLGAAGYEVGDFVQSFGGTSSACPVVAGVAALVLSANPDLTAAQVKRILQDTADKIVDRDADPQLGMRLGTYDTNGYSQWFGYGKVNAFKAVQAAQKQRVQTAKVTQVIKRRNDNNLAIPDDNPRGVTSTIQITESGLVQDIQVTVDIEHEFLGDLDVELTSPNGQAALLQSRTLGVNTQLQYTYSVDNTPALKSLLNQDSFGNWQLRVIDSVPTDTGKLKSWELVIGI
ncbi:MAG: S8 family serine peptidase [Coleofasciculus chthonoplastes F3-SA18-01]|uniref:S8 family serine peptidase n=1 Tax=Coleofasciculus chthonoplastes TaxID=64178 RepID=UPI003302FC18